jgi:hypothetical protein
MGRRNYGKMHYMAVDHQQCRTNKMYTDYLEDSIPPIRRHGLSTSHLLARHCRSTWLQMRKGRLIFFSSPPHLLLEPVHSLRNSDWRADARTQGSGMMQQQQQHSHHTGPAIQNAASPFADHCRAGRRRMERSRSGEQGRSGRRLIFLQCSVLNFEITGWG